MKADKGSESAMFDELKHVYGVPVRILECLTAKGPDGRLAGAIFTGRMRVHFNHFNRHGAAPLVWCIATDTFELVVTNFTITTPLRPVYRPKATADDDDGKPSAWLETVGTLTIGADGHARIS